MSGRLEVVCGPVGSGKSKEIERIVSTLKHVHVPFLVFKPEFKHSSDIGEHVIKSSVDKKGVDFMLHIAEKFPDTETIIIDGANFYTSDIIDAVEKWVKANRVICVGLDTDFSGKPFATMAMLMAMADDVTKLKGICAVCKKPATKSQLVEIDEKAPDEIIEFSAFYEPRCRKCHKVPQYKPSEKLRWIMDR